MIKTTLALEERALNAWPALQTMYCNGWALRLSGGFTKRANSVNALCPVGSFEDVRLAAEELYGRHKLPAIFRLSPLASAEADAALEAAGYSYFDPSLFMTTRLASATSVENALIESRPSEGWLAGFAEANSVAPALRASHDAIVRSISLPSAFLTVQKNGQPVGYGLDVCERGMVGLYDLVVMPEARGQGAGRSLTQAILAWGREMGAEGAYLNVRRSNEVALSLYASLGFEEAYSYHYRMPPGSL